MTAAHPDPLLPETLSALVAHVARHGGRLRKLSGGWHIVCSAAARRPPELLAENVVAALLSRGHLVPCRSGGYQTLQQAMAGSGRLTDHRPRRSGEAAAPEVNDAESPLGWLRARRDGKGQAWLSEPQYLAGERLRADYERGCLGARTTSNWDPSATAGRTAGNTAGHVTDAAIAARQALHAALDAVGPELSSMLVQVCCLSAGLEQAERLLEMPQRSGKAVLALALTRLARHYGLLARPKSSAGRGLQHWGLPDFRPDIPSQPEP